MPIRLICSTDGPLCLRSATTSFWHNRCRRGPSTPSPFAEIQKLGHYPPSFVSLIHSAALPRAHRSGRQARLQNAVADADRHAAAVGGRMTPTMYKDCAGVAPPLFDQNG